MLSNRCNRIDEARLQAEITYVRFSGRRLEFQTAGYVAGPDNMVLDI